MFHCKKGFSLIELIIVLIIVGILSSIAGPMIGNTQDKARWSECVNTLGAIRNAVKLYYVEHAHYPYAAGPTHLNALAADQTACQSLLGITIDLPKTNSAGHKYFVYCLYDDATYGSTHCIAYGCIDKDGNGEYTTGESAIDINDNGKFNSNQAPQF